MKNQTGMENLAQGRLTRFDRSTLAAWLAGTGALLSGFLLLVAFLLPGEELPQHFILSISPLALLPAILFLYRLYRWEAPILSRLALLSGLLGTAPALIQLGVSGYLQVLGDGDPTIGQLDYLQHSLAFLGVLLGVWMVLITLLGWASGRMPIWIAATGWVAGIARVSISGSMAFSHASAIPFFARTSLWNLALLVWIASTLTFLTWLGLWLISGKTSPN